MNGVFCPVLMEEDYWANSQFSVVRYTGAIRIGGIRYYVVNKDGKDVFQLSVEAEKLGRDKAIEPGEPADLLHSDFIPYYRSLGRERFIEILKEYSKESHEKLHKIFKEAVKRLKD